MDVAHITPRGRAIAALLAGVLALAGPAALPARAAAPVFGTPTATSVFGNGITFTQPVTLTDTPSRIEILVSYPGATGPIVGVVDPATASGRPLTWTILLSNSGLVPNTTVSARWRITDASGAASVGPSVSVTYEDTRFTWKTKSGPRVRLHWYEGDDAFAARALGIAEGGVQKAVDLLGVTETDPIDFYVYADQQAFLQAMGAGTPEFVVGQAHAYIRTMFACIGSGCPSATDAEVARTVPHELTHLVFDTATHNPYHVPPHWLNEGLATYLSEGYAVSYRSDVEAAVRGGTLIPLTAIAGNFPSTYDKAMLSYGEGTSAVDFAIRTYGQAAFVKMVRSYALGRTDAQAFMDAFGVDDAGFEAAWLADLGAAAPEKFGPQPAPANPAFPPAVSPGTSPAPTSAAGSPVPTAAASGAVGASPGPTPGAPGTSPAPSTVVPPGSEGGFGGMLPLVLIVAAGLALGAALALVMRARRAGSSPDPTSFTAGAPPPGWVPPDWQQPGPPQAWQRPVEPAPAPADPALPPWQQPQPPSAWRSDPVPPWAQPTPPLDTTHPRPAEPPEDTPPQA